MICLAEGEWEENLAIEKGLTLRAAQIEPEPQAVIRSAREGWPVILIRSREPIEVTIQGLVITGAFGATFTGVDIYADGISVHGKATAVIDNNTISGNGRFGILMLASTQATIASNTISDNERDGIRMWGSFHATITGNLIRDNERYGVALWEPPCFNTDDVFTGYITGRRNLIPWPDLPGGNRLEAVCPVDLDFLLTTEGGELDRREKE